MGAAEDQLFQRFGREFPTGTTLFKEGEPGKEMYVVQSGLVHIVKRARDVEKVIGKVGPGEFFGEMALLNNKPRNASAVVADTARCLVISPPMFEAMIRGNIEIAVRLIKKLAQRLEEANEQIENLLLRDPHSRVAHLIWRAAEKVAAEGVSPLKVALNARELPAKVGLRQDQVDDVLGKMTRAKLAIVSGESIEIPDLAKLKQYLEFLEMKERFGDV